MLSMIDAQKPGKYLCSLYEPFTRIHENNVKLLFVEVYTQCCDLLENVHITKSAG